MTKLGMIPLPRQLLCYLTLHNFPDVQKNIFIRTLPSFCWIGAPSAAEVGIVSAKVFFLLFIPDWNNNRNLSVNIKDKTFIS